MKSVHNIHDEQMSMMQEFSPLMTCIKSFQGSEALFGSERLNFFEQLSMKKLKSEQNVKYEDGFCFAVSLQDGSTLYVSSAITKYLGYPRDMLVGHCIMNFLYQKDHVTFANHLTQGLNACFNQGFKDESHLLQNTFFCRLRVYHGLKFGYGISEKKTQYKPFKVTLHINDLIFDDVCVEKATSTLCCRATAAPVYSAYQAPEEIPAMTSFSTRHTASCHFSHIDASAIPYLGYLPQDMIGYSVFDFYHIDDMPQLKDIYELVIKEQGTSFRSKPYRFKVFNGCYITLETEWSCFINPWSRKLEFVVGQHRVLKGPTNINIFEPCIVEETTATDEILKESQLIQKEIRNMLVQPIKDCTIGNTKRFCNKRKRDLASFVYSFIDGEGKKRQGDQQIDNCSSSDSDSVVMGDISPHQDVNDSSSFSETPPLSVERQYNENIERFFASQPKTFSDGSEEYKKQHSNSDDSTGNASSGKQQESFQSASSLKAGEDQKQQESSSTSSKYNMSSLTNCDSGYKSHEAANPSSMSQSITDNTPVWTQSGITEAVEKFPCITLTEERLHQHNRLTNKHIKHRKPKTNMTSGLKENDWIKQNESGKHNVASTLHKHRKCARVQTDLPPLTNMETNKTTLPQQSMFNIHPPPFSIGAYGFPTGPTMTSSTPTMPSNLSYPSFGMSSYPYLSPNCSQNTTTSPFAIPVLYMGTLPCYPTMPNIAQMSGVPFWPCNPMAPSQASSGVFPSMPHGYTMPMPPIPCAAQVPSSINSSMNPLVQPSGATATTTVLTTTTTVAPGSLSVPQEAKKLGNTRLSWCVNKRHSISSDTDAKDSMQMDASTSSSFMPSLNSETLYDDDIEDRNFETKFKDKSQRPVREDPFWLSKVDLTHDIVYRYKLNDQNIEDVLMKDMKALKKMTQPLLVSKQLELLRHEFQNESKTKLEESTMLGLTTHDTIGEKEDITDNEDNLFDLVVQVEE